MGRRVETSGAGLICGRGDIRGNGGRLKRRAGKQVIPCASWLHEAKHRVKLTFHKCLILIISLDYA